MNIARSTKTAFFLFFGSFILFGLTLGSDLNGDAVSANFGAWHLVTVGSPWIENANFIEGHPLRDIWVVEIDGHEVIARAPGVVLWSLPAYWIAQTQDFTNVPAGITAAMLSAFAVTFVYLAIQSKVANKLAIGVALVFGFGTPVWAVAADTMWPHAVTVFGISGMAWAASKDRWWLVGVFGGFALTGRVHVAIVVAVVGLGIGVVRKNPSVVAKVGIPSGLFLGLTMVWNNWLYGNWNPTGAYQIDTSTEMGERYGSLLVNQLGMWVSPDRGIFIWTPVLLLMLPAVIRAWPVIPDWSKWLATGGLVYTFAQGWANVFDGGDFFWSYRLGLEFVAAVTPAVTFSIPFVGSIGKRRIPVVAGLQIFFIGVGAVLNIPGVEKAKAWTTNSAMFYLLQDKLVGSLILIAIIAVIARLAYNARLVERWPVPDEPARARNATG